MAIEFRCPSCNKLLRTPEGTQGKQAKCPQCGGLTPIPMPSAAPPAPQPGEFSGYPYGEPSPQAPTNPYQSGYRSAPQEPAATDPAVFHPTLIDFGIVLNKTWEIYKNNLGMCVVGGLLTSLCVGVASGVWAGLIGAIADQLDGPLRAAVSIILAFGVVALIAYFYVGLMKYMLTIARGRPAQISELFQGASLVVPSSIVFVLLLLGTLAGVMLLVIPGVLFMLYFSLAPYFVVDQQAGAMDSFRLSARAMEGNKITMFLFMLVVGIATSALSVVTCGLANIFTTPFQVLAFTVLYLSATGQATAADQMFSTGFAGPERTFAPGQQPL